MALGQQTVMQSCCFEHKVRTSNEALKLQLSGRVFTHTNTVCSLLCNGYDGMASGIETFIHLTRNYRFCCYGKNSTTQVCSMCFFSIIMVRAPSASHIN